MKKLRIFCAVQVFNWEQPNLIDSLVGMGHDVIHWDFRADGWDQYDREWETVKKKEFNEELLKRVGKAHAEAKLDLFFGYLSDPVVYPQTIQEISTFVDTLNFGCNDINSFQRGHLKTASCFNLNWTTNIGAAKNYTEIGAKVFYAPYGINPNFYRIDKSRELPKFAFDVSFIGQPYGYRLGFFTMLVNKGLKYALLGKVSYKRFIRTVLESRVCLGFCGLSGYPFECNEMKQLRLRDFEVPALGSFYLTERQPFITTLFEEDKEMVFYSSLEEFTDKAIFYSRYKNRKARLEIARSGQNKCLNEYTWEKQFGKVFKELNLI
tara:strand:- start:1630 stop:2595 length:966 start_codon:yes stop_codon:yes gene_type:complete